MENLSFEIEAKLKKLTKGLDRASAEIDSFAKKNEAKFKKFGESAGKLGQNMSVALTLPLVALGTASVKAASDFEETESKFNTVFKNIQKDAKETADELVNSYGQSSKSALQLLGDTGDLLTGFGFSQKAALDLSGEVNKLAVDLASFTNFSGGAEGASQALTKALLGERESLKSLGIAILEADVNAQVLANTKKGLTFETERQAKAFATLELAQKQSLNAVGDFARTSDSFANQMRILQNRVSDLGVEFGKILMPYAKELAKITQRLIKWFSDLDDSTKKIIVAVAGLVAVAGPLLVVIGGIASALPTILTGLAALTGPIGLVIAGITALTAVIVANWDTITAWAQDIANYFIELYNESIIFRTGVELVIGAFKSLFEVGKFIFNALVTIVKTNFAVLSDIVGGFGMLLKDVLTFNFDGIEGSIKRFANSLSSSIGNGLAQVTSDAKKLFNEVGKNATESINNALSKEKLKPIDISASEESKQKLTEDVANAVQAGVQQGMQGRAQTESVASGSFSQGSQSYLSGGNIPETLGIRDFFESITEVGEQTDEQLEKLFNQLDRLAEKTGESLPEVFGRFVQFGDDLNNLISNSLASTLSNLGTAIGEALANGTSVTQAIGQSLLNSMGQFISQLGDLLIQYGLFAKAKGALDTAIAAGGPAAILAGAAGVALGVALKAVGGAITSRVNQGLGGAGGTGATATSGGVDNNFSQSFVADREIILRVRGRDLVAVLNNQTNFDNAIG